MYEALLDDPKVQRLPGEMFRQKLLAAMAGEVNEFSPHMKAARSRPNSPEWARLRATVFERDDYTCTYCGKRGVRLECDHVMPAARGGSDDLSNLTTACFPCNRSKRDKTPEEWKAA